MMEFCSTRFSSARRGAQFKFFLLTNILIFIARLLFGCVNVVYFTHSIVILVDLLMANVFCESTLFNALLQILVVLCAVGYVATHLVFFELVETTLMAIIAGVYEITVKWRIEHIYRVLVRGTGSRHPKKGSYKTQLDAIEVRDKLVPLVSNEHALKELSGPQRNDLPDDDEVDERIYNVLTPTQRKRLKKHEEKEEVEEGMGLGAFLLNEFLDGSSGVMYTSFFGLVLVEVLNLFFDSKDYMWCSPILVGYFVKLNGSC